MPKATEYASIRQVISSDRQLPTLDSRKALQTSVVSYEGQTWICPLLDNQDIKQTSAVISVDLGCVLLFDICIVLISLTCPRNDEKMRI